jgi:glycosyltransferase involved in cell wall biosynthesis
MKIAVFTDLYLEIAGGIPSSISAQKQELEKLGHKVTVFCPGFTTPKEKNVVLLPTATLIKTGGAPTARWPKIIVKFIEEKYPNFKNDFDLIHVHYEAGASIAAILLAKKYKMPLVQTMHGREDMAIAVNVAHPFKTFAGASLNAIHGHYLKKFVKKIHIKKDDYLADTTAKCRMWELMVREANCADQVITPSQHFADKLKHYGVSKPITAVSNGVSDKVANESDWKVRTLKKGSSEPLRIIWTSRLSREKRILPFLEALKIVKESSSQFFFTAVGDGNEFEAARKYVLENGLSKNVKFLGAVPHEKVLELLRNEHLSIINSYGFDTQGLTILEAGAVGLPVIYCDKDMDQVVLKDAGVRAEDETPEKMAELILNCINNPEVIEKMSKAAFKNRDQVLQSTQIKSLLKVYEKALKK